MLDALQNTVDGLMIGASYAMLGLGFTLIFGVMRRLNLSYGPTAMMGVYAAAYTSMHAGGSIMIALAVSVIVSVAIGLVVETVSFRAVKSGNPLTSMISAFALWMVLEEIIVLLTWGRMYPVESPLGLEAMSFGPFLIRGDYLVLLGTALVLMAVLYGLVFHTRFGRAMRAVAEDERTARLLGIDVGRVSRQTFMLASALGGLVAFFIAAALQQITPQFGLWATVKGLIVMVLGGIGSIPGAVLGGLLLGVVEQHTNWYLGANFRDMVAFLLLFLLLVLRPYGLLGYGTAGAKGGV